MTPNDLRSALRLACSKTDLNRIGPCDEYAAGLRVWHWHEAADACRAVGVRLSYRCAAYWAGVLMGHLEAAKGD